MDPRTRVRDDSRVCSICLGATRTDPHGDRSHIGARQSPNLVMPVTTPAHSVGNMDTSQLLDAHLKDGAYRTRVFRCIRPAAELRRIDRILSQWSDDEILSMHGTEARDIARLLEIRAELEH